MLTAAQNTAFFELMDQMGFPHDTVIQLQLEDITMVANLMDFDKDSLQQLVDNFHCHGGRILDPNPNTAKEPEMTTVTCDVAWYYDTISRDLTQANMHWNNVIKNVETNRKGLLKCKEDESPDIPTITKALPILKWAEAFQDFLHHLIGIRNIPLAYVV